MKRACHIRFAVMFAALMQAAATLSHAATPNIASSWDDGTTEGWTGVDNDIKYYAGWATNAGSYLSVSFTDRSQGGVPGIAIMRADASAAMGRFVGNYRSAGVALVSCQIFCPTILPDMARLVFHSPVSGSYWYYPLNVTRVGEWAWFDVPFSYASGWTRDNGPTPEAFEADIGNVDWVGVWIFQNQTTAQSFGLDNFVLTTSTYDSDGDGTSDLAEIRSGTDPRDSSSVFRMDIMSTESGIVISWPSRPGMMYDVWRSTDLHLGFVLWASGIPADPIADFTTYMDTTALGNGPYYYRASPR